MSAPAAAPVLHLRLDGFEGPLDLLLELARAQKVDLERISILALVLLGTMPAHPSYWEVAWRMALCGSGFGSYLPPNARLIVGSAPRERAAAAGGLVSTVRLTGQTTGATLVAALGLDIALSSPEELRAIIVSEIDRWAEIVRISGARAD